MSAAVQAIHAECNRVRETHGLEALAVDAECQRVSQDWAERMAATGQFAHGGGEQIIAFASWKQSPQELIRQWLDSPGHRRWLLSRSTHAGWGEARGKRGWYWAGTFDGAELTSPAPQPPTSRPGWLAKILAWLTAWLLCATAAAQPLVTLSYSHRDSRHKAAIEAALSPLVRVGAIRLWSDSRIRPGSDWQASVSQAIDSADVVLLLVSADFVASDFCWREAQRAIALRAAAGTILLPVQIRPLHAAERMPWGDRQYVDATALDDEAWCRVAAALESVIP